MNGATVVGETVIEDRTFDNLISEQNQIKGIKQEIHVKRDYKTIQEAIDAAKENTLIKIDEGLYKERLVIRKTNLFFEPSKTSEIYLVGEDGPTITIDVEPGSTGTINIQGFKITNKGHNDAPPIVDPPQFNYVPKKYKDMIRFVVDSEKNEEHENLIYIKSGSLSLYHCELTANLFYKVSDPYISCIYAAPQTQCIINECKFKGSENCTSNGVTVVNANVSLKYSSFQNFNGAGVLLNLTPRNICNIYMCNFSKNNLGIMNCRENNKSKINESEFIGNSIGVYIGMANDVFVNKSTFKENVHGIVIVAADPIISECSISHNSNTGISVYSEGLLTASQLFQNEIFNNHSFGIRCIGEYNSANLKSNRIYLNKRAGVFVNKRAYISVFKNEIFKNIGQGICIKESAGAMVEKNVIRENIKANLAIGGTSTKESVILKNEIINGRCEGIFLMESTLARIYYNEIQGNHFGILTVNSSPIIIGNKIKENNFHGIMAIKKCSFVIANNEIHRNKEVGLYIRDSCKGSVEYNQVINNKIDVIIEERSSDFEDILGPNKRNTFGSDIRIPTNSSICRIF